MNRMPLQHVRILDLTQAWAGSYALQLLADFGAEVIKVESRSRPDGWRGGFDNSRGVSCYPTDGPGERPYNRSYLANSVNRNKFGITLDLNSAEGKAMFLELAKSADVVTENFTPRVLGNLGIGYEVLQNARRDIILLSMPGFGLTGPYRDFPGNGGTIEAMSSSISLLGEPGGKIQASGIMFPDPIAGLNGAAAVLSALQFRDRTGQGCHVEVSQQESMIAMLGEFFEDNIESLSRLGNRDRKLVPNGIFRAIGDDEWVAISVRTVDDWRSLVACLDDANLRTPDFCDAELRRTREAEIENAIATWCALRTAHAVESQLVAAGVPAARVRNMADVVACPQLTESGYLQLVDQPEGIRPALMPGIIAHLETTPGRIRMPPTGHGEHSREVLSRLLGLDDSTLDDLDARGIIGSGPPPP